MPKSWEPWNFEVNIIIWKLSSEIDDFIIFYRTMMNIIILETQISVSQIGNRGPREKGVTTVAIPIHGRPFEVGHDV
jgi:hypothetical protein